MTWEQIWAAIGGGLISAFVRWAVDRWLLPPAGQPHPPLPDSSQLDIVEDE